MNHCAILSNAFSGHEEMRTSVPCPISDFRDQLVCPKPRRLTNNLNVAVNGHADSSLRWNLRSVVSFLYSTTPPPPQLLSFCYKILILLQLNFSHQVEQIDMAAGPDLLDFLLTKVCSPLFFFSLFRSLN